MTKVLEWTKAEIGVGAAIAKGNQGLKGKRALFVEKVTNNRKQVVPPIPHKAKDEKSPHKKKNNTIETKKRLSPNRFISRVKIPEVVASLD